MTRRCHCRVLYWYVQRPAHAFAITNRTDMSTQPNTQNATQNPPSGDGAATGAPSADASVTDASAPVAAHEASTSDVAASSSEKPSIEEVMEKLQKPIPKRLLEEKPATGGRNAQMLTYCPWHRVQRILNHYTNGYTSYEVVDRSITPDHIMMTVQITIHAAEGDFKRDGTGLERLDVGSYGDPQSNAESMAFRRAAARFGLGLHLYDGDN